MTRRGDRSMLIRGGPTVAQWFVGLRFVARWFVGLRFVARLPLATPALLALLLAGGCAASGAPTTAEAEAGHAGDATIVAQGLAFDRPELVVPAGRAFSLTFDNRDGAPHNVSISDATGTVVFAGEIFSGPAIRRYAVPPLEAGRYAFRCDVHPGMAGEVNAGAGITSAWIATEVVAGSPGAAGGLSGS